MKKKRAKKPDLFLGLAERYYSVRRKLGLPEFSEKKRRACERLNPGENVRAILLREDAGRLRMVLCCLLAAAAVGLLAEAAEPQPTRLIRPSYGEDSEEVSLWLTADGETYLLEAELASRLYTEEEWEEVKEEAFDLACRKALADNPDWEHVSHALDFSEETGISGVTVQWESPEPDVISPEGEVAELSEGSSRSFTLTARLAYEDESCEREVPVTVTAPELSAGEKALRMWQSFLAELLADRKEEEIGLPSEAEGTKLSWSEGKSISAAPVLLLGILAAAACWYLPEQRRKEALASREKELSLAYSELVWKLTVLMSAGSTARGAWERLAGKTEEEGVLIREMRMTANSLGQGTYEEQAYLDFGRRCGLPPYLRLGSLLSANIRKGNRYLLPLLREEAELAFHERLQMAKRRGEEISSRMLLPMMLLFAVVLVLLMAPAFFAF